MLKRFVIAFIMFMIIIIPGAFGFALIAASSYP